MQSLVRSAWCGVIGIPQERGDLDCHGTSVLEAWAVTGAGHHLEAGVWNELNSGSCDFGFHQRAVFADDNQDRDCHGAQFFIGERPAAKGDGYGRCGRH